MDSRPIGVFDSGVGGLTVARAMLDALPNEALVYFGDTGRGPYGSLSRDEVRQYSLENVQMLVDAGVKMVVVACNSASAAGLEHVREEFPSLPLVEVVEPAVRAAIAATRNRTIGIIGTSLTIASGAYEREVKASRENVDVVSAPCPRFVEFVERGETTGEEIIEVARGYLAPLLAHGVDTIVLGCTHYPLLRSVLQFVVGREVLLIESDREATIDVFATLTRRDLHRPTGEPPSHRFLCSGDPVSFERLGRRFLGPEIEKVELRLP